MMNRTIACAVVVAALIAAGDTCGAAEGTYVGGSVAGSASARGDQFGSQPGSALSPQGLAGQVRTPRAPEALRLGDRQAPLFGSLFGGIGLKGFFDFVFRVTDGTPPTITNFSLPGSCASLTVPITALSAVDNIGVTGFLVQESAAEPKGAAGGWLAAPPASFTFSTAGTKTLYAFARDAMGNVSPARSAEVAILLPSRKPLLMVTSDANPFSGYYAEILRSEGLNGFVAAELGGVSAEMLEGYDTVLLGEMPLTALQVDILSGWVRGGGRLVAMRPDKKLAAALGVSDSGATVSEGYLLMNSSTAAAKGLVDEPIQFHGTADLYGAGGGTSLATLYSGPSTSTGSPAVTVIAVGERGGEAAIFAFDLARSVVATRQGNPAWSGQERDGIAPIRSDDLFFGAAAADPAPDWVDPAKIAIPQADEQQRLLANLIIEMSLDKKPLPRFWYLPRFLPAAVVMTGDDHGSNGTTPRFDSFAALSAPGCSLADWECIRATSYIFLNTPLDDARAAAFDAAGFEISLHVSTGCQDWTLSSLNGAYTDQLAGFGVKYPSLPAPATNRTHCIVWSDYANQPAVELDHGIRLDTSYYFWPAGWVQDRPGLFTGSGFPMRFADSSGRLIDVYQAPTQMTDESGQSYPLTIDTLLDQALGPKGYYAVLTVNAHHDAADSAVATEVIASAVARGIPVISARQLLAWLDGRNGSTFDAVSWNGTTLSFTVKAGVGARGLVAMAPMAEGRVVASVTAGGTSVPFETVTVKGIRYARFAAAGGDFQVNYAPEGGAR